MLTAAINTQAEAAKIVFDVINKPFAVDADTLQLLGIETSAFPLIVNDIAKRVVAFIRTVIIPSEHYPSIDPLSLVDIRMSLVRHINGAGQQLSFLTVGEIKYGVHAVVQELLSDDQK